MCPNGGTIKDLAKAVASGQGGSSTGGGASTETIVGKQGLLASVLPRLRKKNALPILDTSMTPNGG